MVRTGPPERPTDEKSGTDRETTSISAAREAVEQYRTAFAELLRKAGLRAALVGFATTLFTQSAAAAPVVLQAGGGSGWCGVPGGATVLPLGVLLAQGALFVVGGGKAISSFMSSDGGGDYGANSSRVGGVFGIGVAGVGVLLPQLATWVMEQFGTTAAAMGLGCAF